MQYLLDTNVLSEPVKISPQNSVLNSIKRHQHETATAAPVWHALNYGCQYLPVSRKLAILEAYV
jgi:tRNA(fMet)-specific endonuclease VapC